MHTEAERVRDRVVDPGLVERAGDLLRRARQGSTTPIGYRESPVELSLPSP